MKKRDIEITTLKQQRHESTLAKESAETHEMHTAISQLSSHRATLTQKRDTLKSELASLQQTLSARRDAQAKHAKYLSSQSRHNIPELQFWEEHLCLRMEGVQGVTDRLRFVFSHVCERDWEREAWFELDTSQRDYGVSRMEPKLEDSEVAHALEKLNEGRELAPFFKAMREAFVRALK
jgi:kinetochore protein Spc25, fungi type